MRTTVPLYRSILFIIVLFTLFFKYPNAIFPHFFCKKAQNRMKHSVLCKSIRRLCFGFFCVRDKHDDKTDNKADKSRKQPTHAIFIKREDLV